MTLCVSVFCYLCKRKPHFIPKGFGDEHENQSAIGTGHVVVCPNTTNLLQL